MTRARLADVGLVVLAVFITIVNSGFSKPLWIDEYLHFAMGSLTFTEAVEVIAETTGDGVNWGQTGTYLFLDYLLGSVFGANLWALRSPSIISGLVLLLAAVWFMRTRGLGRSWQLLVLLALAGQATLMYYIGEARPYLPMAAASVAVLAFYSTPLSVRRRFWVAALGAFGLLFGAAMHPYWLPFTLVIIAFVLWVGYRDGSIQTIRDTRSQLSLFLLVPSVVIYAALAFVTWLSSPSTPTADPWEWMGSPEGGLRTLLSTHLDFMSPTLSVLNPLTALVPFSIDVTRLVSLVLVVALTLGAALIPTWRAALTPPLVLLWLAIVSSLALAALSLVNGYWILQRQWLAGIALIAVAFVWGLGELWKIRRHRNRWVVGPIVTLVWILITTQAAVTLFGAINRIGSHESTFSDFRTVSGSNSDVYERYLGSGDVVPAGNVNVVRGGPVWREHARYYGRK